MQTIKCQSLGARPRRLTVLLAVSLANLLLRPMVRLFNAQVVSADSETGYSVTLTCKSEGETHLRLLLLRVLSQGGLGLRRIDSSDIPDTSQVAVTAQVVAAKRNDATVEQIVGRLSLEPHISMAAWQVDRAISQGWIEGSGVCGSKIAGPPSSR